MSEPACAWSSALDALERGAREEAERLLGAPPEGASPADRRVAALLRATLEPTSTAPDEVHREALVAGSGGESTLAASVERALVEGAFARAALAEGRVDDLVHHAAEVHRATPHRWAWLKLRSASLDQAAFRFTGRGDVRDRGIATASAIADRVHAPHMAVLARGILATIHLLSGRLHTCLDACAPAVELAEATGLAEHQNVALAHQFRGYVLLEWNRLDEAGAALETAWTLAGPRGLGVRSGCARVLAELRLESGDTDAADLWLARLEEIVTEPMTRRNREWLAAVRIRHGTERASDLRAIDAWRQSWAYREERIGALEPAELAGRLHELEHLVTVLETTSQWRALYEVAGALRRGSHPLRLWFAVRAETARAVALSGLGREGEADDAWRDALAEGAPEGFVRVYLDGAPARLELLRRARDRGNDDFAAGYAGRVLAGVRARRGDGSDPGMRLSPRQRDVLAHVARGLTDAGVAEALGISTSTAKTHLREIYRRLGVASRTQAIAEGRRLGLLPLR
jgi:ATP/maltotriose-dependent transcriptional regulator MalT